MVVYLEESPKQTENNIRGVQLHAQDKRLDTSQVLQQVEISFETFSCDVFETPQLVYKHHEYLLNNRIYDFRGGKGCFVQTLGERGSNKTR